MNTLLQDTELNTEQRNYVETIDHSASALLTVINDILDFSKIEAGKLDFEQIEFDLHAVISDVSDLLAIKAEEKAITFTVNIAHDLDRYLIGDPGRLRQVLLNILHNAIKFTPERGSVSLHCHLIKQTAQQQEIGFTIRDTGVGFRPRV